MYTRETVSRNFQVARPERVSLPGFVKAQIKDNIVQTWAICRPVAGWAANAACLVSGGYQPNQLIQRGSPTLMSTRPLVEMDPSDRRTWQRDYVFYV